MATHFICQPTEPLAHHYPLHPGPGRGHGAVSHYELLNTASKPHTEFPPPDWESSQSSEDSLPLCNAPVQISRYEPYVCDSDKLNFIQSKFVPIPQPKPEYPFGTDPDLCITPEKSLAKQKRKDQTENGHYKLQQVRFQDSESSERKHKHKKTYQMSRYSDTCDKSEEKTEANSVSQKLLCNSMSALQVEKDKELEKNVTNSAFCVDDIKEKPLVHVEKNLFRDNKCHLFENKQNGSNASEIPKDLIKQVPKRKAQVTRETKEKPELTSYMYPHCNTEADSSVSEHVFKRPEYNSTLRMRKEIEEIKESHVDVHKALDRKLKKSESVTSNIREKAASKVNQESTQFSGLISLSVPVNAIESQHTFRAKQVKHEEENKVQEPDLMEFFSQDLQREFAELSTPGLPSASESLQTVSHIKAFELYKHNRMWNNTM